MDISQMFGITFVLGLFAGIGAAYIF